jgi:ribonuclease E
LRLRDLAGLIVIDFIDMDEKRNNRAVERKLSDCLRHDRARIQVGRISHFGLLEMSRQRIRASMLESSTEPCPHCGGSGHVRSVPSVALQLLRSLEETLMKGATHNFIVRTRTNVALYVLNQKRGHLRDLEQSFKVGLSVVADPAIAGQQSFIIDRGEQVHTLEAAKALMAAQLAAFPPQTEEITDEDQPSEIEAETPAGETEVRAEEQAASETEGDGRKRKRRRTRRERPVETRDQHATPDDDTDNVLIPADFVAARFETGDIEHDGGSAEAQNSDAEARAEQSADEERRPRRRGRRGGRRRRGSTGAGLADSISDELGPISAPEVVGAVADFDSAPIAPESQADSSEAETHPQDLAVQPDIAAPPDDVKSEAASESEKAVRRRSTVREKVNFAAEEPPLAAPVAESQPEPPEPEPPQPPEASNEGRPRRAGWWSRRFGSGA